MDGRFAIGYSAHGGEFDSVVTRELLNLGVQQEQRRLSSNSTIVNKRAIEVLVQARCQVFSEMGNVTVAGINAVVQQLNGLNLDISQPRAFTNGTSEVIRSLTASYIDDSEVSHLLQVCRLGEVESIKLILMLPNVEIKKSDFFKIEMDIFLSKCRDGKYLFYYLFRNPNLLEMAVHRLYFYNTNQFFKTQILKELKEVIKGDEVRLKLISMIDNMPDDPEKYGVTSSLGFKIRELIEEVGEFQRFIWSINNYGDLWLENQINYFWKNSDNYVDNFLDKVREFIQDQGLPLTPVLENTNAILKRYDQLSDMNIEKTPISYLDRLKIAIFIETRVMKVQSVADRAFNDDMIYPRVMFVDGDRFAYLVADDNTSAKSSSGKNKSVISAARISLQERSMRIERVVCAVYKENTAYSALTAKKEFKIAQELSHLRSVVKYYKYFDIKEDNESVDHSINNPDIISLLLLEEFNDNISKLKLHNNERDLVTAFSDVIEFVHEMHRERVIHGDLKSKNIVFKRESDGRLKLGVIDFEFAEKMKESDEEKEEPYNQKEVTKNVSSCSFYPTSCFSSPELMYRQVDIDKRRFEDFASCEVWALGIVLYGLRFRYSFFLVDRKFYQNIKSGCDPEMIYQFSLAEYKRKHDWLIEEKWRKLMSKERKTLGDRIDLIIYNMLRFDQKQRFTMDQINSEMQEISRLFEETQSLSSC